MMSKCRVVDLCAAAMATLACTAVSASALAQDFPVRNVRMLVPFAPGGGADLHARTLGNALSKEWGRSVVIDNKGGAGGGVAASTVARAEADGHTLFFATHPILAINPSLYRKLAYDPDKDFLPVVKLGETALMLMVSVASGVNTVPELIKLAKEKPGALNFGSGGPGTTQHLSAELFQAMADIRLVHVPFKGGALANAALMSGQIHLQFDSAYPGMRLMQAGKLRGLAVTSKGRLPMLPDMPAMSEMLPGYESVLGYGILVPAGTAPAIVAALNRDINKVLSEPAYKKEMESRAIYLDGGTPEQFRSWLGTERKKWGELIRRLKLSVG
ncbi:MAG: tripartite tricarboxylate transporter substrate binding protein [Betaproteobacteria bacterium]|nr:MAG: tripartite tricarboxylate transporter substrate binding protein [Betaproteobacteria bacterium]